MQRKLEVSKYDSALAVLTNGPTTAAATTALATTVTDDTEMEVCASSYAKQTIGTVVLPTKTASATVSRLE